MKNYSDGSTVQIHRDGSTYTVEHIAANGNIADRVEGLNLKAAQWLLNEHPANW